MPLSDLLVSYIPTMAIALVLCMVIRKVRDLEHKVNNMKQEKKV